MQESIPLTFESIETTSVEKKITVFLGKNKALFQTWQTTNQGIIIFIFIDSRFKIMLLILRISLLDVV